VDQRDHHLHVALARGGEDRVVVGDLLGCRRAGNDAPVGNSRDQSMSSRIAKWARKA
jgi:hypothetical protein